MKPEWECKQIQSKECDVEHELRNNENISYFYLQTKVMFYISGIFGNAKF